MSCNTHDWTSPNYFLKSISAKFQKDFKIIPLVTSQTEHKQTDAGDDNAPAAYGSYGFGFERYKNRYPVKCHLTFSITSSELFFIFASISPGRLCDKKSQIRILD